MELDARVRALVALVGDHPWLWVNTALAWIPALLALALFTARRDERRGVGWWAGAVVFVLFLPNAPYVVTDLVHLRADVERAPAPVTTVLPVYAAFIASGFLAYYLSLLQVRRYVARCWPQVRVAAVVVGLHFLVAVGVFLGRWSRLNSWEPVVHPKDALERVLLALTWSDAPLLVGAIFAVTAVGHFVTRAVVETAWRGLTSWFRRPLGGPRVGLT